jgi:membrane fusion protein, multidrug efflux system
MLAEIELSNPKLELRPGMYAIVKIGIERKEHVLLVPAEALVTEKAGTSVFTIADGKAKKLCVQTGFNDGTNVEIINGLNGDLRIALVGKQTLADGQPVQVGEGK